MNDMRVKLMQTLSVLGTSTSLSITITGLSDRELPTRSDMLVAELWSLCIMGCGMRGNENVLMKQKVTKHSRGCSESTKPKFEEENLIFDLIENLPKMARKAVT